MTPAHPLDPTIKVWDGDGARSCARERAPDNAQYRIALGVTQYRLGRFQKERYPEALAPLTKCDQNQPATLAFLAMTQHQLGKKEQGEASLNRLRGVMKRPKWTRNDDAQGFLREVERLLNAGTP